MSNLDLTVVILTHRADERLKKCLDSIKWASEILVLDDNSGFNWKAYKHVKVLPIVCPVDNFGAVRNQGLEAASHEWVLFLDSDESLESSAESEIKNATNQEKVDGWWLPRQDYFAGKKLEYGEVGNVYFLRLMRRKVAQYERTVHEFAVVAGETANLDVVINHEPHLNVSEFVAKVNRYASLEAKSRTLTSKPRWYFEAVFFPPAKFFLNYVLKLGFLDGWRGLIYAYCMSLHSLLVRIYLYERYQT